MSTSSDTLKVVDERRAWDSFVMGHADGHPLQLWAWGELKRLTNWRPLRLRDDDSGEGAQMLVWPLPHTRWTVAYVPRGPLGRSQSLLAALAGVAREANAIYLRLEPGWPAGPPPDGWFRTDDHILLSKTYTIDLTRSEAALVAAMRSKTRQYIRKAEALGVKIVEAAPGHFDDVWRLYNHTAARAGFALHSPGYYRRLWDEAQGNNVILLAQVRGRPAAFLWIIRAAGVAFELYGGMDDVGAEVKSNYLLKWEAIHRMQMSGLRLYDFNGRLNEGVSHFKSGFGPTADEWIGTLDLPIRPHLYRSWQRLRPIGKRLTRVLP